MTRDEARRAALLSNAWEGLYYLQDAVGDPPASDEDQYLKLCFFESDDVERGGVSQHHIHLDLATAKKLMPALMRVVQGELRALDVEIDPPLSAPEEK